LDPSHFDFFFNIFSFSVDTIVLASIIDFKRMLVLSFLGIKLILPPYPFSRVPYDFADTLKNTLLLKRALLK
jgi:hypothetical protein